MLNLEKTFKKVVSSALAASIIMSNININIEAVNNVPQTQSEKVMSSVKVKMNNMKKIVAKNPKKSIATGLLGITGIGSLIYGIARLFSSKQKSVEEEKNKKEIKEEEQSKEEEVKEEEKQEEEIKKEEIKEEEIKEEQQESESEENSESSEEESESEKSNESSSSSEKNKEDVKEEEKPAEEIKEEPKVKQEEKQEEEKQEEEKQEEEKQEEEKQEEEKQEEEKQEEEKQEEERKRKEEERKRKEKETLRITENDVEELTLAQLLNKNDIKPYEWSYACQNTRRILLAFADKIEGCNEFDKIKNESDEEKQKYALDNSKLKNWEQNIIDSNNIKVCVLTKEKLENALKNRGSWDIKQIAFERDCVEAFCKYNFNCFGNITNVTIPESVKFVGFNCFSNCKNLEIVEFKGRPDKMYIGNCTKRHKFRFCCGKRLGNNPRRKT